MIEVDLLAVEADVEAARARSHGEISAALQWEAMAMAARSLIGLRRRKAKAKAKS